MHSSLERLSRSLADRYSIERELGRGGMATVYLARDLKLDRQVAIKVLLDELGVALGPERFRREIALATQLTHPHILPVYDSGEAEGQLYYVMPYVAGESLRDRLDVQRQLPVDEALRITCEIASALEHAHQRGIVHRDIKPENILLEGGQALVADFGIARAVSAIGNQKLTKTGVSLGTPAYMSPEQAMADPSLDARSDIYSLGCVLYEMLAGTPPFTGPTAQAVIARHALAEVPSLTVARGSVPDEVEDAVVRAMAKVPADRFATASEFAAALRACQPVTGSGPRRMERRSRVRTEPTPRWPRARRVAVGVSILAVAALAVTLGPELAGGWQWDTETGGFDRDPRRIAVLYFDDRTGVDSLGHLADGLTEGLIDELRQVPNLDVISRNGVAPFRGSSVDADSVGRALQAGTVVRGILGRAGDRVRVEVWVYDGNTGTEIDRTAIERDQRDILVLRDSLPHRVALLLRQRVGFEARVRETRAKASNAQAWLVYERGRRTVRDARNLAAQDSIAAARAHLARADSIFGVAEHLDPKWPQPILARAALAQGQLPRTTDNLERGELIARGLGHVERALALDPQNAEALELRGTLRYMKRFYNLAVDPTEAASLLRTSEQDLATSTKLDPMRASAWNTLSLLLYRKFDRLGAHTTALKAYEADAYLESTASILERLYGTAYDLENFVQAKQWCDLGHARYPADPRFVACRLWLMTAPNFGEPDPEAAWQALEETRKRYPASRWEALRRSHEMLVAVPLERAGLADSAERVIERARAGRDIDPGGELIGREIIVRTLMGDREKALELLGPYLAAFPQHREGFTKGNTWWWRSLQDDARFRALVGA